MSGDILERILAVKREEVAALKKRGAAALRESAAAQTAPRGFATALRNVAGSGRPAVIAEIKKASPSKGLIRADFNPAVSAQDYAAGGASCLSVLTDAQFFQGAASHLEQARGACTLPCLRKDFVIDELQVLETRSLGADAVLLIAAALAPAQMRELEAAAHGLNMDVLVEVHDAAELDAVLNAGLPQGILLGINNRSLHSFETRLETTLELLPRVPRGYEVVTESGINRGADIARLRQAGVQRFLIGESLMREPSPGAALKEWLAL